MAGKFLVAFGTAAGSTAEVAEAIGEEFRQQGAEVDVIAVEDVREIHGYDAVVVGSAVRVFRILPKTRRFLRKYKRYLQSIPVANFLVCMTVSEKTPENIEKAKIFAKSMMQITKPVSLGLFGGCMDPEKLTGFFAKSMKDQPKEDHRDWEKIHAWGKEIFPMLVEE